MVEDPQTGLSEDVADQEPRGRRWFCPRAQVIAGYVDGLLPEARRSRVQRHLADCAYCRTLVADIVRIRRAADLPTAPPSLIEKAIAAGGAKPSRSGRIWMPVTAVATAIICTLIAVAFLRPPRPFAPPAQPITDVPVVPNVSAPPPRGVPEPEIVRNQALPQASPTITSPKAGSTVTLRPLRVEWQAVPHSVYYQIRVVTSEGDLAWEGQSTGTLVDVPDNALFKNGKYFVLLSAFMEDGHVRKSDPVSFQIARSR